jgi:hypothetical protein
MPLDYIGEKFEQISIGDEPQGNTDPCDIPSDTSSHDGNNDLDGVEAEPTTQFRQWIDSESLTQLKQNSGAEATPRLILKAQSLYEMDGCTMSTMLDGHGEEEKQFEEYMAKRVLPSPDLLELDEHEQYSTTDSDFRRLNEVLIRRMNEMEESQRAQIAEMQRKLDGLRRELEEKDAEMLFLEEVSGKFALMGHYVYSLSRGMKSWSLPWRR